MGTMGSRIKELMEKHKIRVPELSDKTGVNAQTIYGYVKDKKADPSVYNIYAIAKYFNVSMEWLLVGDLSEVYADSNQKRINEIQAELDKLQKTVNEQNAKKETAHGTAKSGRATNQ